MALFARLAWYGFFRGGGSANYAPTPRPVSAPKSPGNYAPTYQPTESEDRRLAGAPTLRGSYSV